jgi:uncharacterized membrane protein
VVQHAVGLLLAVVELIEAEAARLKLNLRHLVVSGAVALIAAIVAGGALLTGSVFLTWAFFAALRPPLGEAGAALTVGLTVWIVVGGATWLVIRRLRRKRTPA